MKSLYPVAIALFVTSCNLPPIKEEEHQEKKAEEKKISVAAAPRPAIVIDARYTDYAGLPAAVKADAHDSYVVKPVGYEPETIDKKKGYYLKLTINNKLLAKASNDGSSNETDLLDTANLRALYGKYRNRPYLYNAAGAVIVPTMKHEGYDLFHITRNKDIDTTYWGPVNDIPARLVLSCSNLDSTSYPDIKVVH